MPQLNAGTLAVLLALLGLAAQRWLSAQEAPRFISIGDGAFRLTQWWAPLPGLPLALPITVGLVREGSKWLLVDAGVPDSWHQPHASHLLAALHATIPAGDTLAGIALTHTHLDHVGALPLLLKDFPNTPVLVHEREKAQLLQGRQHGRLLALVLRAAGLASPQADRVPAGRLTVLEEPFGSLDSIGLQSVVYLLTPGHSPGHVVYLCSGADALLAGDAVSLLKPRLRLGAPPSHASVGGSAADAPRPTPQAALLSFQPLSWVPAISVGLEPHVICPPGCNETDARRSICGLAHAMYFGRLIPGHDASAARGATWTQAHVQQLAAGIPECGAFAGTGGQPDDGDGLEEAEDADQQQEDEGDEYE